ncbi:MAG: hypothetical protein HY786_06740, partial [Deltaproteobacteria bacterium]|nr:hypothetical protein [Deltaproteobacteria bacterium]
MPNLRLFVSLLAMILIVSATGYAGEIQFTRDDRDRLIRLEEGQKSLQKQIDDFKEVTQRRFDDMQRQSDSKFDNLYALILWGFGILFGGMGILIGFVIWDRRTA